MAFSRSDTGKWNGASILVAATRSRIAHSAAIIFAGLVVYWNSLSGVFLFDDESHIVANPAIRQIAPLRTVISSSPLRPLLPLTLAVNYHFGGLDPTGYHGFNLAVHVCAALVLYGLLRRTLCLPVCAAHIRDRADLLSLAVTLLWVVHPLQTESVTYVVQRCESMMGLFFLLAIYAYLRAATTRGVWMRLWRTMCFVACCLGMACKEVMIAVLPVIWLYDRYFLAATWREVARRRGWFNLVLASPVLLAIPMIAPVVLNGRGTTVGIGMESISPWEYARSQPAVIVHYLRLVVWPNPLCLDYGWQIAEEWLTGILLPAGVVLGLLGGSAAALFRGCRFGFLGAAFFLILAPTSSVVPIQDLCFEHRMYLPLACVIVAIVLGAATLLVAFPRPVSRVAAIVALCGVVAGLGWMTVQRNRVYHNAVAMWWDVCRHSRHHRSRENLARSLNNLGDCLLDQGQFDEALRVLAEAVKLQPTLAAVHGNLARGWTAAGDLASARRHAETALRLEPNSAEYQQQMGLVSVSEGRWTEAERYLREAHRLAPSNPVIAINLGKCLADQKKFDESIACLRWATELDTKQMEARHQLAATLTAAGQLDEAAAELCRLVELIPTDHRAQLRLGIIQSLKGDDEAALVSFEAALRQTSEPAFVYLCIGDAQRRLGRTQSAIGSYEKAVAIDGGLADAQNNLGGLLQADEPSRAAKHFALALRARPAFVEAHCNLASTLARLGHRKEAAEHYSEAIRLAPESLAARNGLASLRETASSGISGKTADRP
jgi:tetratricopeptide (TPR) repeat protein